MKKVLVRQPFSVLVIVLVSTLMAVSAFVLTPASFSESTTSSSGVVTSASTDQPDGSVNVTQHHNDDSRDGLFIDPAFTLTAAANLTRDMNFNGVITGNVYAQPLYIENGPGGAAMVIVVTESNNVYALNATTGNIIWQRNVGAPSTAGQPCGNINPLGITGTPIVDLASRSLFFDAMTTPDNNATKRHLIFSLNVDTGAINAGWPVSVEGLTSGGVAFSSIVQNERGALGIVGDRVYVPYGGHFGDCGAYHGWLVGVKISNPADVIGWATRATGGSATEGGSWAVGGVASDGINPFIATGNTTGTGGTWRGGEAIIKLQPGPTFSNATTDYWAPTNWLTLDNGDVDLGGTGALMVDVPGATPSQLVVAFGKDRNAYVLNRTNLGGVSSPLAQANAVSTSAIIQAPATYRTSLGTYVVFRGSGTIGALRINPTNPPTITSSWSVSQSGRGSPFVTTTNGTNNAIVWSVGSEGSQRLNGYDGDTGAVVYAGGGANELMTGTRRFNTGIAARGRIYLASDNRVYAFQVPAAPRRTSFDFDGDAKTDISVFRPGVGEWWINRSSTGTTFAAQFGAPTDQVTPGDYTGDGKTDIAFWRPSNGNWFILRSEDFSFFAFPFGANGDIPVPADFDGDSKADSAVFRPSTLTWYINKSTGGTDIFGFGATGDKPVIADYDGDGKADIAIYRPNGANGSEWWIRRSSNQTVFATQFGSSTDKPVTGDYTGDAKADVAFWRPSTGFWYVLRSEDFSFYSFPFGTTGDIPVPGDYDGDGKFDAGTFRPTNTTWFVQRSTAGTLIQQFGQTGDTPLPSVFVP